VHRSNFILGMHQKQIDCLVETAGPARRNTRDLAARSAIYIRAHISTTEADNNPKKMPELYAKRRICVKKTPGDYRPLWFRDVYMKVSAAVRYAMPRGSEFTPGAITPPI